MKDVGRLSHTQWECKYHVVFLPKYRRKEIDKIFHELDQQKACRSEEGHLCVNHVHILISI
jgi:putative transposase